MRGWGGEISMICLVLIAVVILVLLLLFWFWTKVMELCKKLVGDKVKINKKLRECFGD